MRRHELSDEEWAIIAPLLPNKVRGVLAPGGILRADKAYDIDAIRAETAERGGFANVPPRSIRTRTYTFSPSLDVEVLPEEPRGSTTGFLIRSLLWFRARVVRIERVMTDNGACYMARLFREVLRCWHPAHPHPVYTPKTNGKAE